MNSSPWIDLVYASSWVVMMVLYPTTQNGHLVGTLLAIALVALLTLFGRGSIEPRKVDVGPWRSTA